MTEKTNEKIELRSEEVQEVMGMMPSWIVRWGITLLLGIIVLLLIGSCFFRYPDVLATEMTLTSCDPVACVVSRTAGKISYLGVKDGENVVEGTLLAVIENSAETEDVLWLEKQLRSKNNLTPDTLVNSLLLDGKVLFLGEIQSAYSALISALHDYRNEQELSYYPKKIASIRQQIERHKAYYHRLQRQQTVVAAQDSIATCQYARDSLLYIQRVIATYEHETSQNTLLRSHYELESAYAALESQRIQIGELEETLLDLELEQRKKNNEWLQNIRTATEETLAAIQSWKVDYCLISPIAGKVSFTIYWSENQFLQAEEEVCSIIPRGREKLIGKAQLPLSRSGKVKVGQRVIVRFTNYPDTEFGTVEGRISTISLVPFGDNYLVEITFPNQLTTNYGITLPIAQEMKATAEIVTADMRLIERLVFPVKKVVKENVGN